MGGLHAVLGLDRVHVVNWLDYDLSLLPDDRNSADLLLTSQFEATVCHLQLSLKSLWRL